MIHETEAPAACPFHKGTAVQPTFAVIDALNGFVRLERRSPTLGGNIPVRATACKPFMDGNEAGLHVRMAESVLISRNPECPALQMTDDHFAKLVNYDERVEELAARGHLVRDGYWHKRLQQGITLRAEGLVSIWTGLLVKPSAGLWLLLTGPFTRRSEVLVRDALIASDEGYTPLFIEFETASFPKDTMWLEVEVACLLPVQPGVRINACTLQERPEAGAILNRFYGDNYFEKRIADKNVGRYRRLVADGFAEPAPGIAECHEISISGTESAVVEHFQCLWGPEGPLPSALAEQLPFAVTRCPADADFDFDGIRMHMHSDESTFGGEEMLAAWRDLYGAENAPHIAWWSEYFLDGGEKGLGTPHLLITPFSLFQTPPGWSTVMDSYHLPGMDGLRGVIATDLFPHAGPVFQFRRTGDFTVPADTPLARLLPIPQRLVAAPFEMVDWLA